MSIIFYWFLWGTWIIAAFIMEKGRLRNRLMFGILAIIILYSFNSNLLTFKFNFAWFFLILCGYSVFKKLSFFNVLTLMFATMSVTICYCLIRIYWLMDPAIFLILNKWMFTLVLTGLMMGIVKSFWLRVTTSIIGLCQGDLLQAIVFYPFDSVIGDADCFNTLTISLVIILGWSGLQFLTQKVQSSLSNQLNQRL